MLGPKNNVSGRNSMSASAIGPKLLTSNRTASASFCTVSLMVDRSPFLLVQRPHFAGQPLFYSPTMPGKLHLANTRHTLASSLLSGKGQQLNEIWSRMLPVS